jgi:hypothetical protein
VPAPEYQSQVAESMRITVTEPIAPRGRRVTVSSVDHGIVSVLAARNRT